MVDKAGIHVKKSIKPKRECASSWLERVDVSPGEIQKRARPLQYGQMEENFRIRRERKWPLANAAAGIESGSRHENGCSGLTRETGLREGEQSSEEKASRCRAPKRNKRIG